MSIHEDHKTVVVLRKSMEPGRALNVATHLSLGLTAEVSRRGAAELERMSFIDYADADGESHRPISALGAIVLKARPGWLRTFRDGLQAAGLPFTDFTTLMVDGGWKVQQERMAHAPLEDLEYLGVATFGPGAVIDPMTRKFSLWT